MLKCLVRKEYPPLPFLLILLEVLASSRRRDIKGIEEVSFPLLTRDTIVYKENSTKSEKRF